MNKRPLAPRFLNKLDHKLLVNRPDTWSTRIHLVFYYGLLFMIALALICFVIPDDPRVRSNWEIWVASTSLLSAMGFIVWLVFLFRFNVFKQYGNVFRGDRVKTFLFYMLIVMMMVCCSYIPPLMQTIRVNMKYSSEELVTDINKINELVGKLERDNIPEGWSSDTLQLVEMVFDNNTNQYNTITPIISGSYSTIDSAGLSWKLQSADSIKRLAHDVYVTYNFFDLKFINGNSISQYGLDRELGEHSAVRLKSTTELYNLIFKDQRSFNDRVALNELHLLLAKYANADYPDYSGGDYYDQDKRQQINQKYRLQSVNYSIRNISIRKYTLDNRNIGPIALFTLYLSMVISLFVFAFRHTTIKTFFLTLLTGIVLAILTGLIFAVLRFSETGFFIILLIYYLIFIVVALLALTDKRRHTVRGIAINLSLLMTPFIPLIIAGFYRAARRKYYSNDYNYYVYDSKFWNQVYIYCEIAGGILLLVLIETLFKKLYRAWYSAPEE